MYGEGKYGYSINDKSSAAQSLHASAIASGTYTSGSVTWKDVDFEPSLSASVALGNLVDNGLMKLNVSTLALAAVTGVDAHDPDGIRAFSIAGSGFDEFFPAYTKQVGNTLSFIVKKSAAGAPGDDVVVKFHALSTNNYNRGDFEATSAQIDANAEEDIDIPELDIALKSIPIVAKTRKLKAVWTPELAQDLNAYHSVDAEAELTSMLSDYISMEIDLEILDMLIADAQTVDFWSAKSGEDYDSATRSFATNTFYGTRFEWYQTLIGKIQKVSNEIHRLTLRGGANFVVVGPKISTILESIPGYMSNPGDGDAAQAQFAMGVSRVGQAGGRYTIYKNPYMSENQILVGFRGSNFLETGAVYSPYVPLITTPLVYDPSDFTPRKGVMTRYAKKMIRPEFYGLVKCKSLDVL